MTAGTEGGVHAGGVGVEGRAFMVPLSVVELMDR